jgi:hypothetical protein
MIGTSRSRLVRLRALCAAVAFALGSLSAQVFLASSAQDVCSMACCVEDGHCCCNPRRASVKGQAPDANPALTEAELVSPCPEGCTNSTASFSQATKKVQRPASHLADFSGPDLFESEPNAVARLCLRSGSASPRAPPLG